MYDFEKRSSVLRLSQAAAQTLGPVAATLARGEGLVAHARSAEARIEKPRRIAMAKVYAMYKTPADPAAFDRYYYATHVPIAKKIPGLRHYEVTSGAVTMLDGRRVAVSPHRDADVRLAWRPSRPRSRSPEGQATAADLGNFATGGVDLFLADTKSV